MTRSAILAIDQGTTGTRAILYASSGKSIASAYQEFHQSYPSPGWVEHNPLEIWQSVLNVIRRVQEQARGIDIAGIGITNQRETTVLWDRKTGEPVYPAIVWQDRRTAGFCAALQKKNLEKKFRERTGLTLDPYFSGTKIHWLLEHIPGLRKKAGQGRILFGTVDSWLLWKLTNGNSHATDLTNASRTLLFNIRTQKWDPEFQEILNIPRQILPQVFPSSKDFGLTARQKNLKSGIPIASMIGDQQAALYGQSCYDSGQAKNTYGTGCFLVLNLGKKFLKPPAGLLATLACDVDGQPVYAFEGSVFIAGALVQWLRDGLHFFENANETQKMAESVKDSGGVILIPALAGLGAPYWNPHVRGMITGLTRGTTRAHIVRAALEAIAHQNADVVEAMIGNGGARHAVSLQRLKVDGGATKNHFLMQFQADLLQTPVLVSERSESTAWGAAKLAGHQIKFWKSQNELDKKSRYRIFYPKMKRSEVHGRRALWKKEIHRLLV